MPINGRYPLLWNMPAESQGELVLIMNALTSMHGVEQELEKSFFNNSSTMWDLREPSGSAPAVLSNCHGGAIELPHHGRVRDSVDSLSTNRKAIGQGNRQSAVHFSANTAINVDFSIPSSIPGGLQQHDDDLDDSDAAENV